MEIRSIDNRNELLIQNLYFDSDRRQKISENNLLLRYMPPNDVYGLQRPPGWRKTINVHIQDNIPRFEPTKHLVRVFDSKPGIN